MDVPFNRVSASVLDEIQLGAEFIDEPLRPWYSVVVRTDTGACYAVGNLILDDDGSGVTLDTQLLLPQGEHGRPSPAPDVALHAETPHVPTQGTPVAVQEDARSRANDPGYYSQLGNDVAISGETIVVAASNDDNAGGQSAGAAYVLVRNGAGWIQLDKLRAYNPEDYDGFGTPGISGDTIVIGAASTDSPAGSSVGSAYVLIPGGIGWYTQAELRASDGAHFDFFGRSVAISSETVLVGAPRDDTDTGSAYVFVRNGIAWSEQAKLTASDAELYAEFGKAVSLEGTRL